MTGEMGYAGPGQDQKTAVVHDSWKVGLTRGVAPTDITVPRGHAPGGTGEQERSQRRQVRLRRAHPVAQLCPVRSAVAEIVMLLEILPEQTPARRVLNPFQLQGPVLVQRPRQQDG